MIRILYARYEASLYQSNCQVFARLTTSGGKTFEITKVVFGVLDELSPSRLIDCCAQETLKNNIAIFPYPSLEQHDEVWVFEATPAAAHHLWEAKKIHCKESSAEHNQKILTYLKTALKIQGGNPELEKAILATKQKLILQAEIYATTYLCETEKVLFLKMKEGMPAFEQLLEWIHVWKGEKQPHVYLMRAVVYEFLLDQPLLAAGSYASLAQVSEDAIALACMKQACSFFTKTDPVLNYAHFLEKIDRKFLAKFVEKYPEFDHILLQKDAIRMTFERALVLFEDPLLNTKCFICCSPQDEEVVSWVHHALAFDLAKIGVSPIYAAQDLSHIGDYKSFQAKISSANKVIVICTPELKAKCMSDHPMGIAEEIRLVRERYGKPELAGGISLLYLQGNRQTSCPSPFLEPIFAGQHATADQPIEKTIFNYYDRAFEFFAPLTGLSNLKALEIKECFIDAIQDVLTGKIIESDVNTWRKCRWEKAELGSLQDLQKIYSRLESTQPHLLIQQDLRDHYASKKHLTLLVSQKQIPIKQLYTRLAIIGEAEKKETQSEIKETKPGQSLELEDRRPLTHESIFEPKKAILLEELFKHDQLKGATKRILIQGSAGIGKSTLCHHIAYRWAQKTLFTEFEYLLWLPLRCLDKNNVRLMQNLTWNDYVAQECGLESPHVHTLFSDPAIQKKTLVLLDGYDELSGDATNNQGCFYPVLQALQAFPNVIITSRPREIRDFKDKKTVILEILGFDSKGIEEYIEHFFSKDQQVQAQNLRTQLQQPLVKSLAHIPINLEIFCSLVAANEPLFNASESPTLIGIYIKLTDWLFKRFRIERNKKDPDEVISEPDADSAFDVGHLTQVMEQIAWKAMDLNTLYPPLTNITKICRSVEKAQKVAIGIGIESIRSIGPLRIEDNQGVFIHLTFQEYFAAAHLARLYQNNQQEAGKLLAKIKFEPRYRLVLWMTAGSLSQNGKLNDLQAFFKDLYSEPRDLAESYELALFAQCFEECLTEHLEQIAQYKGFITSAVSYIKKAPIPDMKFQLLNRNIKLVCNFEVKSFLIELMQQPKTQLETIDLLEKLARGKLPPETLSSLVTMAGNADLERYVRGRAIEALGKIAASGQTLPPKALAALVEMAGNADLERYVRGRAIEALGKIAASGQTLPPEALLHLVKIPGNTSLPRSPWANTTEALGKIAGNTSLPRSPRANTIIEDLNKIIASGQTLPPEALMSLVEMTGDPSFPSLRANAIEALGKITASGQTLPPEALSVLVEMARNPFLKWPVRESTTEALGKIAASRQTLPPKALSVLVEMAGNPFLEWPVRASATGALGKIAASRQTLPPKALSVLVEMAGNPFLEWPVRESTIEALGKIAASRQTLPQKALSVLVEMAGNPSLGAPVRASATGALDQIAGSGQTWAIEALGKIAASRQALSPEALSALVKIAGDLSNKHVRERAIEALKQIEPSQLFEHLDLAKEVCYLTHRAWVESEHQVSISGSNCRMIHTRVSIKGTHLFN